MYTVQLNPETAMTRSFQLQYAARLVALRLTEYKSDQHVPGKKKKELGEKLNAEAARIAQELADPTESAPF